MNSLHLMASLVVVICLSVLLMTDSTEGMMKNNNNKYWTVKQKDGKTSGTLVSRGGATCKWWEKSYGGGSGPRSLFLYCDCPQKITTTTKKGKNKKKQEKKKKNKTKEKMKKNKKEEMKKKPTTYQCEYKGNPHSLGNKYNSKNQPKFYYTMAKLIAKSDDLNACKDDYISPYGLKMDKVKSTDTSSECFGIMEEESTLQLLLNLLLESLQ